jgi:mono/diheme cytochrome c family protein
MTKKILLAFIAAIVLASPVAPPAMAADGDAITPAEHKRLFREGAKLWPVYCNTCHNARPGSEKAPYEWDQIMMHMREVGNLPAKDTQAILEYLKAK